MSLQSLFSTQVLRQPLINPSTSLFKSLDQECYQFRKIDGNGEVWSKKNYPGGFTSYGSITNLPELSPHFLELKTKIDKAVQAYIKSLQFDVAPKALQLSSMWINIMSKSVTHSGHIHPLSVISGTFYVRVPEGVRGLKFEDPRLPMFMGRPPVKRSAKPDRQSFVEVHPKPGDLVLFESWLRHEVPPNPISKDRVSISFNYDW